MRQSVASVICFLPLFFANAETRYQVQFVPNFIPAGENIPRAINDLGQVAGESTSTSGMPAAYFWDGQSTTLVRHDSLLAGRSRVEAINNNSIVVGSLSIDSAFIEAYTWRPDVEVVRLGDLSGGEQFSWAHSINDYDEVVGVSSSRDPSVYEAFFWSQHTGMITLGDLAGGSMYSRAHSINNLGQIVGDSISHLGMSGFIWESHNINALPEPPGGYFIHSARSINELGQIDGMAIAPNGTTEPYHWDPIGGYTFTGVLSPPNGYQYSDVFVADNNDRSEIVGCVIFQNSQHYLLDAFIWDGLRGIRSLNDLLEPCTNTADLWIAQANGINNLGQIAAYDSMSGRGLLLTPYLSADINFDGHTNLTDLSILLANYGAESGAPGVGDLNEDGIISLKDLTILLNRFGQNCQ